MPRCVICGGTEFYIEAGFYFCNECQTQNQDVREEVLELRVDLSTRVRKVRIRQNKSGTSEENLGWTTWEQYNFILIGLTNELMELGASVDIKMTILQLWAYYLGKVEVAFTSTKKRNVPKLARKFCKKDAEIIYGKIAQRKKIRRRGSASKTSASSVASNLKSEEGSNRDTTKQKKRMIAAEYERFVQSQDSSEGDTLSLMNQSLFSVQSSSGKSSIQTEHKIRFNKVARKESEKIKKLSMKLPRPHRLRYREKHRRTVYEMGPQVITPMKLWSLIYLALRIHDENIHLADMLRYAREGHFSYYRLDHLLPPEVTLSKKEAHYLHRTNDISHNGMRQCVGTMAKFLKVWEIKKPDMVSLIERYCIELQLPKEIALYAERMMELSPPRMRFDAGTTHFPNYEGRAMAFIIVIMKILFALDGITEYEIGRVVEKINSASSKRGTLESRLFSFCDWQRYIECRRSVIANVHFPTKLKRDPDSMGNSHLYLKFFTAIRAKCSDRDEPDLTSCRHSIPRELADSMKKVIGRLNESPHNVPKDVKYFAPSPTPQYSYLLQSLRDPEKDLPSELRNDFNSTKVGYMMKPQALQALAGRCNIDLKIRDTGMHFLEKIVSPLEQTGSLSIRELTELVRVRLPVPVKTRCDKLSPEVCENTEEYLHRKNPGFLFVDSSKRKEYDDAHDLKKQSPCNDLIDDFGFDEMFPNSKHLIPNVYDDDDSSDKNVRSSNENDNESRGNVNDNDQSIIDLLAKYNVSLSNFEKRSLAGMSSDAPSHRKKREKRKIFRDPVTGKFVKPGSEMKLGKTIDATSKIRGKENVNLCENDESASIEESIATNESRENDESTGKIASDSCPDFGLSDDDISILHESSFSSCNDRTRDDDTTNSCNEFETLFRPYTDYWLLRCMFNRASQSSFRQNFSSNFRWLLEECSSVIEMTEEDLYEEVCLVEAYYADIIGASKCPVTCNRYDSEEYRSKIRCNGIRKK